MVTDFHGFDEYDKFDSWDYNQEFQKIDARLELRGALSNRPGTAPDGAKYVVDEGSEEGNVYIYDSGAAAWGQLPPSAHDHAGDDLVPDQVRITGGRGFLGLPSHHINYADGLSNEEVARFTVATGHKLEVWRLEAKLKGGGTNVDFTVDVYDETNATVLASTSDVVTGGSGPIGTSGEGATILVRVSNATTNPLDACLTGIENVVKV